MKRKTVFLTGASGFLGWSFIQEFSKEFNIYATYNSTQIIAQDIQTVKINFEDLKKLSKILNQIKPDLVIHLAAISDANYCQSHPQLSEHINVILSQTLAEYCSKYQIPYLYTSSDLVFDGKQGDYSEDSPPNPVSLYGQQKVRAEKSILSIYPDANIFRVPLMYGASSQNCSNGLYQLLKNLSLKKEIKLFFDEFRTPARNTRIAREMINCYQKFKGILHLAGHERISRYQFGQAVQEIFNFSNHSITKTSQKDIEMKAPRPADVSLNISKAISIGYRPVTLHQELQAIRELLVNTPKLSPISIH